MRLLLLSDIHANQEALQAVLGAAEGRVDRALCLGDVVGYGADPAACVALVQAHAAVTIRGNHDRACVTPELAAGFNALALAAARWTHTQLPPAARLWLAQLPAGPLLSDGIQLAHGMPQDEDEYLTTRQQAAAALARAPCQLTFVGHTHLQGGFLWRGGAAEPLPMAPPPPHLDTPGGLALRSCCRLEPGVRYIVNPGSVGQPRDGDWRAAFLIYDTAAAELNFFRVPYPVRQTQEKILAAHLPPALAARLAHGH